MCDESMKEKEIEIYPDANGMIIEDKNLANNPTTRVPVCMVLDTSSSMAGEPITEENKGLHVFIESVASDEIASKAADIAIVTFDSTARLMLDFADVKEQNPPVLTAQGATAMGEGVNLALDVLAERKEEYKKAGVVYYQPWMVLMTDGAPTDNIDSAVERTRELIMAKKLTIFPVGIGPNASMDTLKLFSPKREPLRLKGLNFEEFFEWLSASLAETGSSGDTDGHIAPGWAEK